MDEAEAQALLGRNVAGFRAAVNLSAAALAELVGVHPRHIKAIESGTRAPSFGLLIRLAKALEVAPADLLTPRTLPRRPPGRPRKR